MSENKTNVPVRDLTVKEKFNLKKSKKNKYIIMFGNSVSLMN